MSKGTKRKKGNKICPEGIAWAKRTFDRYLIEPDINGKFDVLHQNDLNKLAETDYCWVYFYLPMQEICNYGDIYIIGDLSHWQRVAHTLFFSKPEIKLKKKIVDFLPGNDV